MTGSRDAARALKASRAGLDGAKVTVTPGALSVKDGRPLVRRRAVVRVGLRRDKVTDAERSANALAAALDLDAHGSSPTAATSLAVLLEQGRSGGSAAAPLAAKFFTAFD